MGLRGPGAHPMSLKLGDAWDPITRINVSMRASLAARIQAEIPAGERSQVVAEAITRVLDERALAGAQSPKRRGARGS